MWAKLWARKFPLVDSFTSLSLECYWDFLHS